MMVCICMYNNMVFPKKKNLYSSVYAVPSLEIQILTYPNLWNILNYTWFLKTKPPYKAIKHFKNKLYLRIYQWMNETFFISTYVLFLMLSRHDKNVPSLVLPLLKLLTHLYHLYSFETDQINKGFSIQSQEKIHFSFDYAKCRTFSEGST